jgi:predicted amidohydrolase
MRIALAQINPCVGDLAGNVDRCLTAIDTARRQKADVVVLPEMVIPGYPPRDILFDPSFVAAVLEANRDLARRTTDGPPVIVGSLLPADHQPPHHPGLYNAALLLKEGEAHLIAAKRLLPAYDVFFEPRWFLPGPVLPPVTIAGRRVGVLICEDLWDEGYEQHPPAELLTAGADLLICISASPYRHQVLAQRLYHARRPGCPLLYVNLCGATDELIFDGRSFALNQKGELLAQLAGFEEEIQVIDMAKDDAITASDSPLLLEEELYQALGLGIRDFAHKNRLERAFVGLSGGIDSALVAVLAAAALGPERVTGCEEASPSATSDNGSARP